VNAEPTWLRIGANEARAGRAACAWLVALLAHGALVMLALSTELPVPPLVAVTEVELLAPPPPVTPPVAPAPAPPPAAVAPPVARRAAPRVAPAPPPPASAAPLRTIDESVKTSDEPVRFVTDPQGKMFGYGAVQRAGSAASAPVGAAPTVDRPAAAAPGGSSSAAPILSRAPQLGESDPCRGFFPSRAQVDRGQVALRVKVEADGTVRSAVVSREEPVGHGFGFAARDCLLSKQFVPALDRDGHEVSVVSPVTVRFSR